MTRVKKIISLLLVLCIALPLSSFAEEDEINHLYIFGDVWAAAWGNELSERFFDENTVINCASDGALLSQLDRTAAYSEVGSGDTVILSYGYIAKDYRSDSTSDFEKNLNSAVSSLKGRGAEVVFASICSTRRQNPVTGKFEETKNFFTETMRTYAEKNDILYVDLARLTCEKTNELGVVGSMRLYEGDNSLTKQGNRLCAEETARLLAENGIMEGLINRDISVFYTPSENEKAVQFDMLAELNFCDYFTVYVKNGRGVNVNYTSIPDGDGEISCRTESGLIKITFESAEEIQIAPVYEFDAGGISTAEEPYTLSFRNGVYDIIVKKSEPLRGSVYANGYVIVSNLDMPGTQPVTECAEGIFRNFAIENGKVDFTVSGKTDKLASVAVRETQKIFDKKPRIFVAGDSTLCNYYPLERTGLEKDGEVQTGWAQLLENHVDAEVVNLAVSGDWAVNWQKESFPTVERFGEKGDIFIIQFGINDHDKSTVSEMKAAISEMIDSAAAKGMIPILVSPQISAGYGWGEVSDIGKSDGGVYEEFFAAVREVASEKQCFYVDLTDLSAGWFSEIGREAVYRKYHLWDWENDEPLDMMHLSYKGAAAMCSFFISALKRLKDENSVDLWGNSLDALTLW